MGDEHLPTKELVASDVHQLLKISQPDCDKLRKSGSHYVSGGEERLVKLWDYVTWCLKATEARKRKTPMVFMDPPRKDESFQGMGEDL